jgi:hypothetical protein
MLENLENGMLKHAMEREGKKRVKGCKKRRGPK